MQNMYIATVPPSDIEIRSCGLPQRDTIFPWTSGSLSQDQLSFASHNKPNCIRYIIAVLGYKFYQCL